jgi:hypothetical protein
MCRLSVPGKIDSVDDKVEGAKSENDGILTSNKAGERGRARGSISSMVRLLPELAPATLEVRSNVRSDESSSAKTSKSLISQSHVEATFETYEERMSRGASSSEVGTNRVSNISNDNLRPSAESHTDSSNRSLNRSNVVSMGIADPAVLRRELDNIKMELGAASQSQSPEHSTACAWCFMSHLRRASREICVMFFFSPRVSCIF